MYWLKSCFSLDFKWRAELFAGEVTECLSFALELLKFQGKIHTQTAVKNNRVINTKNWSSPEGDVGGWARGVRRDSEV